MVENTLEIIQKDIDTTAGQVLNLQDRLKTGQEQLCHLVEEYRRQRFKSQEAIWQSRGLIRCTLCYDLPPGHTQSTPWGGWGLIPPDDAHYIGVKGVHTHRGDHYGSDHTHSQLEFHRLCTPCYSEQLKACALRSGGLLEIDTEQVIGIDTILATEKEDYKAVQALRDKFGRFNEIKVYWHRLPIPERAYEIGKAISLDDDYKNVLRLVLLKP